MGKQFIKQYERRLKRILTSKPNRKNKIQAIITGAILNYGNGTGKWTEYKIKSLDQKTRKTMQMQMHEVLRRQGDVNQLYVGRGQGEKQFRMALTELS